MVDTMGLHADGCGSLYGVSIVLIDVNTGSPSLCLNAKA
jgi:hypothetical protein